MRDSRRLVSKQINWIDSFSNALQIRRTSQFIGHLGITVQLTSIDGSDGTVHREPFQLNHDRSILMECLDESTWISVMKRIRSIPLDRDPMVRMLFRALHLSCYNSFFKTHALDGDPVDHKSTRSTRVNR